MRTVSRVHRRIGLVAATAGVALLLAGAAVAGLTGAAGTATRATAAEPTVAALTACGTIPDGKTARECLYARLSGYSAARGVSAVNALLDFPKDDPAFASACHETGHALGKERIGDFPDLAAIIPLRLSACGGALLHGLLDAAALDGVSDEQLRAMFAACEQETDAVLCGDGIGHLVWTTTQEFAAAMDTCHWTAVPGIATKCVEGVVMRMALPQEGTGTRQYTAQEIAALCRDGDDLVLTGCSSQLAYALVENDIGPAIAERVGQGTTREDLPALVPHLDRADALCDSLGSTWGPACRMEVAGYLYGRFPQMELGLALECSRLPQDLWGPCAVPPSRRATGQAVVDLAVIADLADAF